MFVRGHEKDTVCERSSTRPLAEDSEWWLGRGATSSVPWLLLSRPPSRLQASTTPTLSCSARICIKMTIQECHAMCKARCAQLIVCNEILIHPRTRITWSELPQLSDSSWQRPHLSPALPVQPISLCPRRSNCCGIPQVPADILTNPRQSCRILAS